MSTGAQVDVAALLELGLEESLAQTWIAMRAYPGAGIEELARVLGISEIQLREQLDALADRSLVRASQQSPGSLVPIAAEAAVAQLLQRQEQELAEQQARIQRQRDQITTTVEKRLRDDTAADGQIEHIIGADAVQARFEQLAYTTVASIDSLMPVVGLPAEMLAEAWPLDAELLRRGVKMRSLYLEAIRNDAAMISYARDLEAAGGHVRTAPALPQRLFISDARIAIVPLDPTTRGRGAAVISAPGVIASLLELFDSAWSNAAPLDIGNSVDPGSGLSNTERVLLGMLAEGSTDEAAAKKLGVSLRTVRRIMADLMHRLDAGSRFEAGIKAAKKGWL